MNANQLTDLINNQIDTLKKELDAFPQGGGLECLLILLGKLQNKIDELIYLVDAIEKKKPSRYDSEKNPEVLAL